MSVDQILSAATALREFSVEEVAAFCDETPASVALALEEAGSRFVRAAATREPGERWRVVTPAPAHPEPVVPRAVPSRPRRSVSVHTRLLLAEDTLLECVIEDTPDERRLLARTAANHLRQALADLLDEAPPWWALDVSSSAVAGGLPELANPLDAALLRLALALARLSEREAGGLPTTAQDLRLALLSSDDFRLPDTPDLKRVVDRLWDLAEAVLRADELDSTNAVSRFKATLAKRRTRARAGDSAGSALRSLMTLLEGLSSSRHVEHPCALYQLLDRLPDGRDRVVVYCDLLSILPSRFSWQEADELLPGTMVEAVVERAASTHLDRSANALERHLYHSPFRSEAALLGQTAHVLGELAWADPFLDSRARARVDETCTDILHLAMTA
jgi:hypothetical protein